MSQPGGAIGTEPERLVRQSPRIRVVGPTGPFHVRHVRDRPGTTRDAVCPAGGPGLAVGPLTRVRTHHAERSGRHCPVPSKLARGSAILPGSRGASRAPPTEEPGMVSIPCPWCDEPATLSLAEIRETDVTYTCPACGTSVVLVEDQGSALEAVA